MSDDTTPLSSAAPTPDEVPSPVVTAVLSLVGFVDAWPHCQHVADFLARFAASDRFDPEQLTTRLATYLHEVLELVHRSRPGDGEARPAGDLTIAIVRRSDRLQLDVAVPTAAAAALRRSLRRTDAHDPAEAYRAGFAAAVRGEHDDAGLLELVALHGVTVAVAEHADTVTLSLTVPHE